MPKQFPKPQPPVEPLYGAPAPTVPNIQPEDAVSDPLADLLFDGADQATIAEHLRSQRDEWSAIPLSELLCLCVRYLPDFRRAERDGQGAQLRMFEVQERISRLERLRPDAVSPDGWNAHKAIIADEQAELRRVITLLEAFTHASEALGSIGLLAPALLADPRSFTLGEPLTVDELRERRHGIGEFLTTHKLSLIVDPDGWPRSELRRREPTAGVVRLVTVEKAKPGIRIPTR